MNDFLRIACFTICSAILSPAVALDLNDMSAQEKQAFGKQVHEYLIQNPETIMEALQVLDTRRQAVEQREDTDLITQNLEALENDGFSWVGGNPKGDITLVEFLDYRCGYCRQMHSVVEELLAKDDNIRLVVKEYPVLGEESDISSQIAIATLHALGSDAYKKMHDLLMTYNGPLTPEAFEVLANKAGLDSAKILAKFSDDAVVEQIKKTAALGLNLNINATPSFVLGDQVIRGAKPIEFFEHIIAEIRAARKN